MHQIPYQELSQKGMHQIPYQELGIFSGECLITVLKNAHTTQPPFFPS